MMPDICRQLLTSLIERVEGYGTGMYNKQGVLDEAKACKELMNEPEELDQIKAGKTPYWWEYDVFFTPFADPVKPEVGKAPLTRLELQIEGVHYANKMTGLLQTIKERTKNGFVLEDQYGLIRIVRRKPDV